MFVVKAVQRSKPHTMFYIAKTDALKRTILPLSTYKWYDPRSITNKIFRSESEVSKVPVECSQTRDNSEVIQSNPRYIPNSHLKQKPDKVKKQETSLETVISKPMFYEEPNNVYFKLLASIKSLDLEQFTFHLSESPVNLNTALHSGNTLLHIASLSHNPAFISPLLDRGASPEIRNADNKTPYEVTVSKEIRDEFRRYMGRYPTQWDYRLAGNMSGASPLTPRLEEEQEGRRQEKKRVQREKQIQRDKVKPHTIFYIAKTDALKRTILSLSTYKWYDPRSITNKIFRSIPNSHLKQKPDNVHFKLLASIISQDLEQFTSHLDLSESQVNLDTALHSGNTIIHIASLSPNPAFISPLLDRGASPEIRNADNKTPYQVAASKGVRDEFRRYMGRYPTQWDYRLAGNMSGTSPLTPQFEVEKKIRRRAKDRRHRENQRRNREAEAVQHA